MSLIIHNTGVNYVLKDNRGHAIATVWGIKAASNRQALKMAASTELLDALSGLLGQYTALAAAGCWNCDDEPNVIAARAAIAAATGDA